MRCIFTVRTRPREWPGEHSHHSADAAAEGERGGRGECGDLCVGHDRGAKHKLPVVGLALTLCPKLRCYWGAVGFETADGLCWMASTALQSQQLHTALHSPSNRLKSRPTEPSLTVSWCIPWASSIAAKSESSVAFASEVSRSLSVTCHPTIAITPHTHHCSANSPGDGSGLHHHRHQHHHHHHPINNIIVIITSCGNHPMLRHGRGRGAGAAKAEPAAAR